MKKTKTLSSAHIPETYADLVAIYPPRPLHDKVDYENAAEIVDAIAIRDESTLNQDQLDYLEMVSRTIESYEAKYLRVDVSAYRGLKALRTLVADHGLSGAALSRILGLSASVGSKILSGERGLSKANMRTLGEHFKVSPALFFDEDSGD